MMEQNTGMDLLAGDRGYRNIRRVGVVADDITGANDIGIMFAKNGYRSTVWPWHPQLSLHAPASEAEACDVYILDTDSRFDTPEAAAEKVTAATRLLVESGCEVFCSKTCSVFRGNIGASFDAMRRVLGMPPGMVVAAFPANGRTTVDGLHAVHGVPLHLSQFQTDPVHPATESSLAALINRQSREAVGLVSHAVLDSGREALRACVRKLTEAGTGYCLFDCRDQRDLVRIAEAMGEARLFCGSSAMAEVLPVVWHKGRPPQPVRFTPVEGPCGTLLAAGSLTPQTRAQVAWCRSHGMKTCCLDVSQALHPNPDRYVGEVTDLLADAICGNRRVLLHTPQEETVVMELQHQAASMGLSPGDAGKAVSTLLAEIVGRTLERTGGTRLVVAGGDTSAAVCRRLGMERMRIGEEIEPGLPSLTGVTGDGRAFSLVLKSGSFGTPPFLLKAAESLEAGRVGQPDSLDNLRIQLVETGRMLWQAGLVSGTDGNLSVRTGRTSLLITPSGVHKACLDARGLLHLDFDGNPVEEEGSVRDASQGGTWNPSKETGMHVRIYQEVPACGAIVHAHPPASSAFAAARLPIPDDALIETTTGLGTVGLVSYAVPGSDALAALVAGCAASCRAMLMAHHGALAYGTDLSDAYNRFEALENVARTLLGAASLGGWKPIPANQPPAPKKTVSSMAHKQ